MDTPTVTEGPATKSAQKHGNLRRSVVWRRGGGGGGGLGTKKEGWGGGEEGRFEDDVDYEFWGRDGGGGESDKVEFGLMAA